MNKLVTNLKLEFMRIAFLFGKLYIVLWYALIWIAIFVGYTVFPMLGSDVIETVVNNSIFIELAIIFVPPLIFKLARGTRDDFCSYYKETFAKPVLEDMLENVEYSWWEGMSEYDVENMRLIFMGNKFSSEDHLCATYKGINIESADVSIKNEEHMDNWSHTEDVFEGRIILLGGFAKKYKAVQMFSSNFMKRRTAAIPVNSFTTGDRIFDTQYYVASAEQKEAAELLIPEVKELFRKLYQKYDVVGVQFYDNNLAMALGRKGGALEPTPYKFIKQEREEARMREDVQDIIDIIEALNIVK